MIRAAVAAAALALAGPAAGGAAAGPRLEVVDGRGGVVLAAPLGADGRWCLVWNHSVTGIEVHDCFRADAGTLVLDHSLQPDFAAGLGATPGRGTVLSDGAGGYRIEGIDAALPDGLPLRVGGPAVGHRLSIGATETLLPAALAGQRVVIRLVSTG